MLWGADSFFKVSILIYLFFIIFVRIQNTRNRPPLFSQTFSRLPVVGGSRRDGVVDSIVAVVGIASSLSVG